MAATRWLVFWIALAWLAHPLPVKAMQPVDLPVPDAPLAAESLAMPACTFVPEHAALLQKTTIQDWTGWVAKFSGAEPVLWNNKPTTLTTRNSYALFSQDPLTFSPAYEALREQVLAWYPAVQVEEQSFVFTDSTPPWKNLVLTIPGTQAPDEVVLLTAHFDDMPQVGLAPGADDNASGTATLLEAARILRDAPLSRTVRIIWFTGEEQGLVGSREYTAAYDLSTVAGVINLDMFAYDGDNDRCFEIHVGRLSTSDRIGQCIVQAIDQYDLNLTYDYLTTSATGSSDHASFWAKNIGAVEILENYFDNGQPGGCVGRDYNPFYHKAGDTLANLNTQTAFDIHRAALGALFAMAIPPEKVYLQILPYLVNE